MPRKGARGRRSLTNGRLVMTSAAMLPLQAFRTGVFTQIGQTKPDRVTLTRCRQEDRMAYI